MTIVTVTEKKTVTAKKVIEPGKYKVIICNDEVTSVEFVIAMLISIFYYGQDQAVQLTLAVHKNGSAVAGTFAYEIAEQKSIDATDMARSMGFPLIIKIEAE